MDSLLSRSGLSLVNKPYTLLNSNDVAHLRRKNKLTDIFKLGLTRKVRRFLRKYVFNGGQVHASVYNKSTDMETLAENYNIRELNILLNQSEGVRRKASSLASRIIKEQELAPEPVEPVQAQVLSAPPNDDLQVLMEYVARTRFQGNAFINWLARSRQYTVEHRPPPGTECSLQVEHEPVDDGVVVCELPSVELSEALKVQLSEFKRLTNIMKELGYKQLVAKTETGLLLPFSTFDEYKRMCHIRNTVLPIRLSDHGSLIGGFKGKKKNRKRSKKFKGKRKRMPKDCSPGNVYESSALMVTDATGALNIVIALNNPQQIFSGVTATGAQDLANNWDAYSVERVSMSTQIRAPITARQGEWNLICDHDSSPPTTAITQNLLLTYTSKRSYSSQAAPRWSVVPRKLSQCEYISAPAADPEPAVIVQKGKYDWNTPPSNGFMYVKLIGGPASTNIGTIYVRVHVTAWYKRRLAVAMPRIANVPLLESEEDSSESEEKVKKTKKSKV